MLVNLVDKQTRYNLKSLILIKFHKLYLLNQNHSKLYRVAVAVSAIEFVGVGGSGRSRCNLFQLSVSDHLVAVAGQVRSQR